MYNCIYNILKFFGPAFLTYPIVCLYMHMYPHSAQYRESFFPSQLAKLPDFLDTKAPPVAQLGPDAQASSFPLLGAPSEFLACMALPWLEQVRHLGQEMTGTAGTVSLFGFPFGNLLLC